jgi:hypothetical protein
LSGHTILAGLILISFVVFLCLLPPIYLDEPGFFLKAKKRCRDFPTSLLQ